MFLFPENDFFDSLTPDVGQPTPNFVFLFF